MASRCVIAKAVASRVGTTMLVGNTRGSIAFLSLLIQKGGKHNYSVRSSTLDPPDVGRLAETARISLTPQEVQEFCPKIHQVVEWFGQLQAVDLESIEPAIRSGFAQSKTPLKSRINLHLTGSSSLRRKISVDIDGNNLREDIPQTFENRDAIIAAIPSYEEPYIKVPRILNKE